MALPKFPAAVKERRPKVAILGFTDTRKLAPFGDPDWEIWGLNELYRYEDVVKLGFTRWFEIHERKVIDPDKAHIDALNRFPIPVYMQRHYDDIRASVEFPKREVEINCGQNALMWPDGCKYFTSSIAWMIGLALVEEFEEIHVFGVDMAQEVEYFEQRPACEYLLGLAQGRGIKVYVPPTADLLKAVGQYGWAGDSEFRLKLEERFGWLTNQENQYKTRLNELDNERAQIIANLNQIGGAKQDVTFWKRSWSTPVASNGAGPHVAQRDGNVTMEPLANPEAALMARNAAEQEKAKK